MASREVKVAIIGDPSSLRRAISQSETAVGGFQRRLESVGDRLRSVGSSLTRNLTLPMAGFGYVAYRELSESQRVLAQTRGVIESMGIAAQVSTDDVVDLATELREMSGQDDEGIQEMLNTLLTFRNVVPIMEDAGRVTLDMATFFGDDMQTAATQVGRALNNPLRGITALTRKGVEFTEAQRQQIEAMMAFGNVAGAQAVILEELNAEYGGQAAGFGATLAGQLGNLRQKFEDLAASVLEDLLPVLEDLAAVVQSLADAYDRLTPRQQKWVAALAVGAFVIGPLLSLLGGLASAASVLAGAFAAVGAALGVSGAALGALIGLSVAAGVAIGYIAINWEHVDNAFRMYVRAVTDKLPFLKMDFQILSKIVGGIGAAFNAVWSFARRAFEALTSIGTIDLTDIIGFVGRLSSGLSGALGAAQDLYQQLVGINNLDKQGAGAPIPKGRSAGGESFLVRPRSRGGASVASGSGSPALEAAMERAFTRALARQPVLVAGSVS